MALLLFEGLQWVAPFYHEVLPRSDVTGAETEHAELVPTEATDSKHEHSEVVASVTMGNSPDIVDQNLNFT